MFGRAAGRRTSLAAGIAIIGGALIAPTAAIAVPPGTIGTFPTFGLMPSATPGLRFDGTVDFADSAGFPATTLTTDATSASTASGQSAFLGASTGFGQYFGSTRAQPYLSLSLAQGGATSTTVLDFSEPAPAGWGFALGDIDADLVEIVAERADGTVLTGAEVGAGNIGEPALLNYCNNSPKPSTCAGPGPFTDTPAYYPDGTTVGGTTYDDPVVVGSGSNTLGAYAWFVPTTAVSRLTLRFTGQAGIPNYQLWLAAAAPVATITGTIAGPGATPAPADVTVNLEQPDGAPVLDLLNEPVVAPVAADGTFAIETEQAAYRLSFDVPDGFEPIPPVVVDATTGDVTVAPIVLDAIGSDPAPVVPPITPSAPPVRAAELPPTGARVQASLPSAASRYSPASV